MAHWLVDAMNVIGSRPDGWWRDRPGAMRTLAERLERFAADSGDAVTVFFDGRPVELPALERVEAVFAARGGRDAADDELVRYVADRGGPGEIRVATSDARLAARVRELGAEVVGASTFRHMIDRPWPTSSSE